MTALPNSYLAQKATCKSAVNLGVWNGSAEPVAVAELGCLAGRQLFIVDDWVLHS